MAGFVCDGGWYDTHLPGAYHARINGRHYVVRASEGRIPETVVECDDDELRRIPGTIFDGHERSERGRRAAEDHARGTDGRLEFGANPAPVPAVVTLVIG